MKSYVSFLQGLYLATLSDVAMVFPSLRRDCDRDASRLLSLVEQRGLPFFMVDLPAVGKHFDKCLAAGRLTQPGIAGFRPYSKRGPIPRLFKGLFLRVFDDNGVLRTVPDVACIRYLRQLLYVAKKVKVPCSDSRTWEHVHEFFETDREVQQPSLSWDADELGIDHLRNLHFGDSCGDHPGELFSILSRNDECALSSNWLELADVVQRTADAVSASIGGFNPLEWRTKHGPGAVADQRHTQFKYDFPNWPAKLSKVFPLEVFGFANYSTWATFVRSGAAHSRFSLNEPPSKLIAVPKTLKGPRLIAAEPVSHQWCQQSIKDFLTSRLAKTPISRSIHFRDQRENQDFAKRASHTQSHVTVDLSSASDRLSCWVVERTFRRIPSLVSALHASRTRWVANAIDRKSPGFHKLRKFACMGSACTFPVQTYVFSILAHAAVLYSRGMQVTNRNLTKISQEVRVFGDDIIVPADGWEVLQGLLCRLGLQVNHSKTFASGRFRESCGLDAWDGFEVTPTYAMTHPEVSRPESVVSCVATHNNFVKSGYVETAAYIKSRVASLRGITLANVPTGSGCFGWYQDFDVDNTHLRRRWNAQLHRLEYRVSVASATSIRLPVEDDSSLLQYFTEAYLPPLRRDERIGIAKRPRLSIKPRWVSLEDKVALSAPFHSSFEVVE